MRYRGPLKAVILDWAGTTVDYGCVAPVVVLKEIFKANGVHLTDQQARRDMGLLKKDHIRAVTEIPRVAHDWAERFGKRPTEPDVDRLFASFIPLQLDCLARYSAVIPGVPEAVTRFRERGLKIGSTTGYTRPMLDIVIRGAARYGYSPDASVTPDEAPAGRPAPWMCYRNAILLEVYPLEACVKIGDTSVDIAEGLNAGMWTIGVIEGGNEIGLSQAEWEALAPAERESLAERARQRLMEAGAHESVSSLSACDAALDRLEAMLRAGERP